MRRSSRLATEAHLKTIGSTQETLEAQVSRVSRPPASEGASGAAARSEAQPSEVESDS
jgi:hypothetical protein